MTVALRAAGTPTGPTAGTYNPSPPAGWVSGDLSLLIVSIKPDTARVATPANWTKLGEWTGGVGAVGADTGPTKTVVFSRLTSPTAPGNLSLTGASTAAAVIHIFSKDPTKNWAYGDFTHGVDSTHGTAYSATGGRNLEVTTGDMMVLVGSKASDAGTVSGETLTATGATLSAPTVRSSVAVTTGNDLRQRVLTSAVTAGTSTAAPVSSFTNSANTSGHTVFLRLSETTGTVVDVTTAGDGTWTKPAGVTSVTVEAIGGGAAGRGTSNLNQAGTAGGGGGAYSKKTITGLPSAETIYNLSVGPGGVGINDPNTLPAAGGNTWFIDTGTFLAEGGKGALENQQPANGGAPGLAANSVGDIKWDGERGNTDVNGAGGDAASGGSLVGGDGGLQPAGEAPGNPGTTPGAGGSGANTGALGAVQAGGNGANGILRITYTVSSTPQGSATGNIDTNGTATGHVLRHGTATGVVDVSGAASGHVLRHGASTGNIDTNGSAAGHAVQHGSATGSIGVNGTASGESLPRGSASGSVDVDGLATGSAVHEGSATGLLDLDGAAAGSIERSGSASGTFTISGAAGGSVRRHGSSSGSLALGGTGVGTNGEGAHALGTITLGGAAVGSTDHKGSAIGGVILNGTATGSTPAVPAHHGAASGVIVLGGVALASPPGSGNITFTALVQASPWSAGMENTKRFGELVPGRYKAEV